MPECRPLCEDVVVVLGALDEMLQRPYLPMRAVALRRMIEAALATAVESAGLCSEHADEMPRCARCVADCEAAAHVLRSALRDLVDDDLEERSGAT